MKYRVVRQKEICFMVYYPQYSEDGKVWELWEALTAEGVGKPIRFYLLKNAIEFIKHQKRNNIGPDVVWEDEDEN